jgi:hypothetical protein
MAIELIEYIGSKLGYMGIFKISIKFLMDREYHAVYTLEFWDFCRIEVYATVAYGHVLQVQKNHCT